MLNLGVRCQSPCHAPSVRGAIVLLIYVVLDFIQLVAWSACVGRDVDTSMFLRTVASPETLNG
jgi:hypothetical protein